MLISSPDEHLGSRTHAACLEGEFFAEKVGLNVDLEAQFMNQNDVVKSKFEYEFWRICLGQSFGMLAALIGLNLGSWGHIACLLDIFSSTPVDENSGLEALYSRRFGQGFQKCKCKSWRLWIGLQFDMLIFIIKAKLRSWGALAWLLGDVNIHVFERRYWPSDPNCTRACSFRGVGYVHIEALGKGFRLRCQPSLSDSNWFQDALLGVALLFGQLRAAAARMDLTTRILPQFGIKPSN